MPRRLVVLVASLSAFVVACSARLAAVPETDGGDHETGADSAMSGNDSAPALDGTTGNDAAPDSAPEATSDANDAGTADSDAPSQLQALALAPPPGWRATLTA